MVDECRDIDDDRDAAGQPEFGVNVERRKASNLGDIDAVVDDDDLSRGYAVVLEDVFDGVRRCDEQIDLSVLPPREGMALEVKVDAARRHDARPWVRSAK